MEYPATVSEGERELRSRGAPRPGRNLPAQATRVALVLMIVVVVSRAELAIPVRFEPNRGQAASDVLFSSRGAGYTLLLKSSEVSFVSRKPNQISVAKMRLIGGDADVRLTGLNPLRGVSNYFVGSEPDQWRTGVPHYGQVRYADAYTGIDLVFYGSEDELEYDFVVSPGADPRAIRLQFEGAGELKINDRGDLTIGGATARMVHRRPVIYQVDQEGTRRTIDGRYRLSDDNVVSFELDSYDMTLPLVIDPLVEFATLFGGSGLDIAVAIDIDGEGNLYMAGGTDSTDLAVGDSFQTELRGRSDLFVAKLNPSGTELIYVTYLGGSEVEFGDLAVDAAGNAYLTGGTASSDFPTLNALAPNFSGGGLDAFVAKLNPSGTALIYSTYLGGSMSENEGGLGRIAVDSEGAAYVTGITDSTDFPTAQALQPTYAGGAYDAFVTKISPDGSALVYSTYLGGSGAESEYSSNAIAVDAAGNAYVAGTTDSEDFPTVNPLQATKRGAYDAFVTKISPDGSTLAYSTYLGRETGGVAANDIAVDADGATYIAGYTTAFSPDSEFPGGEFPRFPPPGLPFDGFVSKLSADGSAIVYSEYVASSEDDFAERIAVDEGGNAWTGISTGSSFPTTTDAAYHNGWYVLAKLNPEGEVAYATYFPSIVDIIPGDIGEAYLAGSTNGTIAPLVTPGAFQTELLGTDAYIAKIGGDIDPVTTVSAADYDGRLLAADSIVSSFAPNFADETTFAEVIPLPTELDGLTITVVDSELEEHAAGLIVVTPQQINWALPPGIPTGPARVTVSSEQGPIYSGIVRIGAVAPALFSGDASGEGVAAGFSLLVASNGARSQQPLKDPFFPGALPIRFGAEKDQVFLILFGTGIRGYTSQVTATVGGENVDVTAAVPQGQFVGLDQVNLGPLPRTLAGRGPVDVVLTVDGVQTNVLGVFMSR